MMRDFLNLGFNEDEAGRAVWDGAFLDASAAAGAFNIRFAQPGNIAGLYDPSRKGRPGGKTTRTRFAAAVRGIVAPVPRDQHLPVVMEIEGGADFFFVKGSLGIAGTTGKDDIPLPANVRRYYMASTNHTAHGQFQLRAASGGGLHASANPLPWFETERALLVAMRDWISKGTLLRRAPIRA